MTEELLNHGSKRSFPACLVRIIIASILAATIALAEAKVGQGISSSQAKRSARSSNQDLPVIGGSSDPRQDNDAYIYMLSVRASFLEDNPGSQNLASWDPNITTCAWKGVNCISSAGPVNKNGSSRIVGIDLSNQQLNGVIPADLAGIRSLSFLSLAGNNLSGSIPEELGGLPSLTSLNLSRNALSGAIPSSLGRLANLQLLDLSGNNLSNGIPDELFLNCSQMKLLNISNNALLGGRVPATIQNCKRVTHLILENNGLEGDVPAEIGQLPRLQFLSLANNHLVGELSDEILANCHNLEMMDVSLNNITGPVPERVCNCSKLSVLSLSQNQFQSIPQELGRLENLQWLLLGHNNISGSIPPQIGDCHNLTVLDLKFNSFSGDIPAFLSALVQIQLLSLNFNQLTGEFPLQLSPLRNLSYLDLSNNLLQGPIPPAIANMSSLSFLFLAENHFSGALPSEIGDLQSLQILDLSSNGLSGSIPPSLGNLTKLLWLSLANNYLTDAIPAELGNCSSLVWFNAANNFLSGNLPITVGSIGVNSSSTFAENARSLSVLPRQLGDCSVVQRWMPSKDPPFNEFIRSLDSESRCQNFLTLLARGRTIYPLCSRLQATDCIGYIQLSTNHLSGEIPPTLGQIHLLGMLFLDNNRFEGAIPSELGSLSLIGLNFSGNSLSGSVPASLGQVTCLQLLDLSYNNLSGSIPGSLQDLTALTRFNISYNPHLTGAIPLERQFITFVPSSYIGDINLCYSTEGSKTFTNTGIQACSERYRDPAVKINFPRHGSSTRKVELICDIVFVVVLCVTVVAAGLYFRRKRASQFVAVEKHSTEASTPEETERFSSFSTHLPAKLTYTDLMIATNNFDESKIIGTGGFGVVYKAVLRDGTQVAVKKLIQEGPQADREFMTEMVTLGQLHHENLVPLLGCSVFRKEKLLVYEYMPKGSLEEWLQERPSSLNWPQRLRIATGIAKGLEFLHNSCSPPIIHRDMKASNVLLDQNFEARLTDFGLARIMRAGDTHVSTIVAGTLGYVPPEYCQTWRATTKGDVYSFGVVLLELITGGRAMDLSYNDRSCGNLVEFVGKLVRDKAEQEIFDAVVMGDEAGAAIDLNQLESFLHLALLCTRENPSLRPGMKDVLQTLLDMEGCCT